MVVPAVGIDPPGHRHVERKRAKGSDERLAVEGTDVAVLLEDLLDVLFVQRVAIEAVDDREAISKGILFVLANMAKCQQLSTFRGWASDHTPVSRRGSTDYRPARVSDGYPPLPCVMMELIESTARLNCSAAKRNEISAS